MKEKIIPEKPETIDKLHAGNLICCLNLRKKNRKIKVQCGIYVYIK